MGIKNLNYLITHFSSKAINENSLEKYKNKIFLIDTTLFLYKYSYGSNNFLEGIFFQVNKFLKFNIIPIYVFDGKPPKEKSNTLLIRKKKKEKLKKKISNLEEQLKIIKESKLIDEEKQKQSKEILEKINKYKKSLIYITSETISQTKKLLDYMGIKYIVANCEAEYYASKLIQEGYAYGIISEDMDTIACGTPYIFKQFSNKKDVILEYNYSKILNCMKITRKQFVDLCILCGNDYVSRVKGINHKIAYNLIKKYKNIENIIAKHKNLFSKDYDYQTSRNIYSLDNIILEQEHIDIINQHKEHNIDKLKNFLKTETNIPRPIYLKRINLMFYKKNIYKNKYLINLKKKFTK